MSVLLRHKVPTYVVGSGRGRRTQGVNRSPLRAGGGFAQSSFFLTFRDLGAGVVDTMEGRGQVVPTFTRATAAATKLSTGLWKLDVASGVARSAYIGATTAIGAYGGYFAEGAATQLALNPRDMTQAAWVAVNVAPTQVATGIDGVANSATRLTSAAIGASILQTLVAAASSRTYSIWLRRVTVTGTITISQGATTLDVTASLNSATFTRVELNASVLNSAFGITFGASGDVIEADCNQFEAGAFATSPIPAAGTRNADVLTYPTSSWMNSSAGTLFVQAQVVTIEASVNKYAFSLSDGTLNEATAIGIRTTGVGFLFVSDGGVTQANVSTIGSASSSTTFNLTGVYALNDFATTLNGGVVQTDVSGTLPTVTTAIAGADPASAQQLYGTISRVAYWPHRLSNAQLQALTT